MLLSPLHPSEVRVRNEIRDSIRRFEPELEVDSTPARNTKSFGAHWKRANGQAS